MTTTEVPPTNTEALSTSELRYRRLFEAAHDGILILDPVTRKIIDVNPFLTSYLGYPHAEFVGKELHEIGFLEDESANRAAFRELQANGCIRYEDLPLKTKDGRPVEVEFVSNVYLEGDRQVIQCNVRDISVRKHAATALRESEERFKLVARAVSDVVWDWNFTTGRVWWSEGLGGTFGHEPGDLEPGIESWTSRIHPDDQTRVADGIRNALENGVVAWKCEHRFRCRDGSHSLVQLAAYILRDGAGKAVRVVAGMRDITEQRTLESRYLRAQRLESLGTLAGGIAHDLNNVLTPIMMSIEILKLDAGDKSARNGILDTILVSCQRGSDLIHQVLSFARGVDGERVDLQLRLFVDEFQGAIAKTFPRNIAITAAIPNNLWPINGDASQLHQILLNLAVNARDSMPEGGTLSFSASNVTLDEQFAGTSAAAVSGRFVLLEVTDSGRGIPAEIRDHIFEPFFTTKDLGKGTGLGLATVHTIVVSHGGFITVESEVGHGATFKVYLPASGSARATPGPATPNRAEDPPRGNDELVLVVDDEQPIRDITRQTLEAFGYRVATACDGAEAIAPYARQPHLYSLVITDMMMPVLDGASTAQVLLRLDPLVRIIAVSGLDNKDSIIRASGAGVRDFLAKPYTAQTLITLVREILDRPRLPRV